MHALILALGGDADAAEYAATLAADPDIDTEDVLNFLREALPTPPTPDVERQLVAAVATARARDDGSGDGGAPAPASARAAADASPSAVLRALDLEGRRARLAELEAEAGRPSDDAPSPPPPRPPPASVDALATIYPSSSRPFLEHALVTADPHTHALTAAAAWLADVGDVAVAEAAWVAATERERAAAAEAAAADAAARVALVERFGAAPVTGGVAPPRAWSDPAEGGDPKKQLRYRDGVAVGKDKFIVVQDKPDWDGGSRGKVMLKGKRGKGFA